MAILSTSSTNHARLKNKPFIHYEPYTNSCVADFLNLTNETTRNEDLEITLQAAPRLKQA